MQFDNHGASYVLLGLIFYTELFNRRKIINICEIQIKLVKILMSFLLFRFCEGGEPKISFYVGGLFLGLVKSNALKFQGLRIKQNNNQFQLSSVVINDNRSLHMTQSWFGGRRKTFECQIFQNIWMFKFLTQFPEVDDKTPCTFMNT
eukprot:TRINITY_DN8557_c0_g2_i1.p5 TRINITY_DN8557_c0_g2~~TRINITY_DN8557_c0_g2_i1.p5  ORF type:complete len:147 (-),score=1.10 TRINITY_DN8557_c0_g2_i1:35-475(-)